MRKYIKSSLILISLSLSPLWVTGCGKATQVSKAPTVGEATSIISEDATITYASMEKLNQEIGDMVKIHIATINNKEATLMTKETRYCEINGLKEIENSNDIVNHTSQINFTDCQDESAVQNGTLEVSYQDADDAGRYPKAITFTTHSPYYFNELALGDLTTINVTDIQYEGNLITSLTVKTSGKVTVDGNLTMNLKNFNNRIAL